MKEASKIVEVETFDHQLLSCQLIEVRNGIAIVCGKEEWRKAQKEGRNPKCVGFPLSSVKHFSASV